MEGITSIETPLQGFLAYRLREAMYNILGTEFKTMLDFGCGFGGVTKQFAEIFPNTLITGYDIKPNKIEKAKSIYRLSNLNFTNEKPDQKYDAVVSRAVLCINFERLIKEFVSYSRPGGLVGIVDYDMKGMTPDDFKRRWGRIDRNEIKELDDVGMQECYLRHTKHELSDYIASFEDLGFETLLAKGRTVAVARTPALVYIGRNAGVKEIPKIKEKSGLVTA